MMLLTGAATLAPRSHLRWSFRKRRIGLNGLSCSCISSELRGSKVTIGAGNVNAEVSLEEEIFQTAQKERKEKPLSVTVEDLLLMIREAERNILLLNQVRARALDELEQVRQEQDLLKAELKVYKVKLAEANARIKLAEQDLAKDELLKGELRMLQEKLLVKEAGMSITGENQNQTENSESITMVKGGFKEEVESLRTNLSELRRKNKLLRQSQDQNSSLQEKLSMLESKLQDSSKIMLDLERVKSENRSLKDSVRKLELQLEIAEAVARTSNDGDGPNDGSDENSKNKIVEENRMLQEQIKRLLVELGQVDDDRMFLKRAKEENDSLREQLSALLESDAEIRNQLSSYQTEVESFHSSLELLKSDPKAASMQVPAGEMPWEFWSELLLRIDNLTMENLLPREDGQVLRLMAWRRDATIRDAYVELQDKSSSDIALGLLNLTKNRKRPGLYIVHIAAEMAPVAKVGGLGDVLTGLSRALQRKDHLVEIILPKYDCMDYSRVTNLKVLEFEMPSYFDGQNFMNKIWTGTVEGLPVYFIDSLHPGRFFERGKLYGERDDFRRFTYFSRAALEFLLQSNKRPDIIHAHDWQTAVVAPLYWDIYVHQGLDSARLAFTCHNFEYQGIEAPVALAACGLNVQQQFRQDRLQDSFRHDRINLLKGGIVFSNIITTVSPTYAQEVRGPEVGKGMQVALSLHSNKFYGILNGIDVEAWDPLNDPALDFKYSPEDLTGKAANKSALQSHLNLAVESKKPLVGCITRLVPQKGVNLIRHSIYRTLEKGGQFVLLGSSPVPDIQREFERLSLKFEDHPDVRLILKYDDQLSHKIYAASDIFVIPSLFEPCGLTQMIAMRYGSIPVVRRTGGLNDSVFDADDSAVAEEKRNGFCFSSAEEQGLNYALDRAIEYYRERNEWWMEMVEKVMKIDLSWDSSALQYIQLYRQAISRAKARTVT